jgi:hypothetical protein
VISSGGGAEISSGGIPASRDLVIHWQRYGIQRYPNTSLIKLEQLHCFQWSAWEFNACDGQNTIEISWH